MKDPAAPRKLASSEADPQIERRHNIGVEIEFTAAGANGFADGCEVEEQIGCQNQSRAHGMIDANADRNQERSIRIRRSAVRVGDAGTDKSQPPLEHKLGGALRCRNVPPVLDLG